jgi:hypothetical protein
MGVDALVQGIVRAMISELIGRQPPTGHADAALGAALRPMAQPCDAAALRAFAQTFEGAGV